MKKIYVFLFSCVAVLSTVAQTTPNLYRAVDKAKMNHWVDSVFDAMSYDERVGQLFMVIANPKSDTRNMQRLMRYVNEIKIGGILFHKGDPVMQAEVTNRLPKDIARPDARVVGWRVGTFHASFWYDPFPEEYDVGGDRR